MKRFTEVDAERLEVHLEAGKRIRSFKPDYGGSICEAPSEQKIDQALEFYEGQIPSCRMVELSNNNQRRRRRESI